MIQINKHDPGFLFKEDFFGSLGDLAGKAHSHKIKAFASDDTIVRIDHQDGNPNSSWLSSIDGPLASARAMFAPPIGDIEVSVVEALKRVFNFFKK